jgi:RluA family pseudouridine synthase
VRVLYRDELVIAIDKPAGVATVPGRSAGAEGRSAGAEGRSAGAEGRSAGAEGRRGASGATQEESLLSLVRALAPEALAAHRLDRDTSGVVVFALGKAAHRALSMAFESRRAEKVYLALCRGALEAGRCDLPLAEGRRGGMRIAAPGDARALPSSTEFKPLESFAGFTWAEARPRTGRTHQIRVHLAALGHPLAIDLRYGEPLPIAASALLPGTDGIALDRLPLHAAALRVPHPSGRGWLSVESPLPADLSRCLDLLRANRRR